MATIIDKPGESEYASTSMSIQRTVRQKVPPKIGTHRQSSRRSQRTQNLSSTMEIPSETVFDGVASKYEYFIQVDRPGRSPVRLRLDRDPMVVGRESSCDVCLRLANVSREHARIVFLDEEYVLEDMESTNGTFVNNVRINRCVLRDHDQVRIGEARILFLKRPVKANP